MKKGMKPVNVIAIVILAINIITILLTVHFDVTMKIKNTALFNKEIYSFNDGWVLTNPEGSIYQKVTFPYISQRVTSPKPENNLQTNDTLEPDIMILENIIPQEYWGLTLTFSSMNSRFQVWIDGKMLYEGNNEEEEPFSKKGSNIHFINIPTKLKEGKVQIKLFLDHQARIENIEIAKRDTAILNLISNNLFNIICSLIMLVSCIVLFLLTAMQKHSKQDTRGMMYLGFFSLDACVYYALATQIISIFVGNQVALNLLMYMCLMLLPYFFVIYYRENLIELFQKRCVVLWWAATINIFFHMILYMPKLLKFQKTEITSHVLMFITILVIGISLHQIFKKEYGRRIRIEMIAVGCMLLGVGIDIICVYVLHMGNTGQFGRYGTTLFCVIIMLINIKKVSTGYSESVARNQRLLKNKVEYMKQQNKKLLEAKEEAEKAKKEAISANETKGRFLANMSHEIRTPINAILGMDEMILRESQEPLVKEYAMDIQTAGQSLLSLINDILDFSKIDSGKMEIIPVEYDFSSMIHDIVNMILLKAEAKHLELKVSVEPELPSGLYGDDVRIRQVLINILTNAVKYTEKGSISLTIRGCLKEDSVRLHFEVQDTGIGIKQNELSKLFAEFERIEEKRNHNIEGTGLGMSITAHLLSLMDSKLEVESEYEVGSKFFFDIEQKIINREPIGDLKERIRQMSNEYNYNATFTAPEARILIVDDNLVNCKVFKSLLKETKMQIDEANSGKVCLEKVVSNAYDLIFLDHMMPEMDGIETLHRMQKMEDYLSKDAKVIALTANAISGAKKMYLKEGFDAFLSKPILPDKLEHLIRNMLPKELLIYDTQKSPQSPSPDKEPKEETQTPDIDGLDWAYGLLHLSSLENLLDTIRDFYQTLESQADILAHDYETGDMEAYRIQVHSMKSAAALIGIVPLSGIAKILEYAARDKQTNIVNQLNDIFLNEWRSYKYKLSVLFKEKDNRQKVEDTSIVLAYLEMLRIAMKDMDIDAADQAIENLNKFLYDSEIETQMNKLASDVANLDVESASSRIEKITLLLKAL